MRLQLLAVTFGALFLAGLLAVLLGRLMVLDAQAERNVVSRAGSSR
ncbi:MAG: hypothetical protein R2715_23285 [Ilumatobacteraceae bacterium]